MSTFAGVPVWYADIDKNPEVYVLSKYRKIVRAACNTLHDGPNSFRFRISNGSLSLTSLLSKSLQRRKAVVEKGLYIDIFLGKTRVHKRASKALLYAFYPEIGRFIEICDGRFLVRLPHGLTNVLSVKLVVGYMEEYVLRPRFRTANWKVGGNWLSEYTSLADLFSYIGAKEASEKLELAIIGRIRESPPSMQLVRNIWGRNNARYPDKWAESLADSIVTWLCVPKLEIWSAQWDIDEGGDDGYEVVAKKIWAMARTYEESKSDMRLAFYKARHATKCLDRFLEEHNNIALKQLVWTANSFKKPTIYDPNEFITIATIQMPSVQFLTGIKQVVLQRNE